MESPGDPVRQFHVTFEDDLTILVFLTLFVLSCIGFDIILSSRAGSRLVTLCFEIVVCDFRCVGFSTAE